MFNFKESAKKATVISAIMQGREKIETEDIIKKYPDGITVIAFDIVRIKDSDGTISEFPVCAFKEDCNKFFFGGAVLKKIIGEWVSEGENNDLSIPEISDNLFEQGGVKMKFSAGVTKQKKPITLVEIV